MNIPRGSTRSSGVVAFPSLGTIGIDALAESNKFYHIAQMPAWAYPIADRQFGTGTTSPINKSNRNILQEPSNDTSVEVFETVGERLAKVRYSNLKMRAAHLQVTLPFRTDIMPGTNVSLENTDANELSFIGSTLHGMVSQLRIVGDMTRDKGQLNSYILSLIHISEPTRPY